MKLYQKSRIEEENVLVKKYGLKNKKEIWKTLARINYFRKRAMALTKVSDEEQRVFFSKLKNIGLDIKSIPDVLALKIEDLLRRRLPSIVVYKGIANTVKQARQMVVHKRIRVHDKIIDSPSYIVPVYLEDKITIKEKAPKKSETFKSENDSAVQAEAGI